MECGENNKELVQPVEIIHSVHIGLCCVFAVCCSVCSVLLEVYFCYFSCSALLSGGVTRLGQLTMFVLNLSEAKKQPPD